MLPRSVGAVLALVSAVASAPTKRQSTVPQYVLDYAPLVWLYSGEQYFPSDLSTHLSHVTPEINYTDVAGAPNPLTLDNLNSLSNDVYLTSKDTTTSNPQPSWLLGTKPDGSGKIGSAVATAVIVNDHGNGNVDAFYMYFYSYNWGGIVAGISALQFDDHVGDWEHNMIRFSNGIPTYVWYSQHANGEAFEYSILEKSGLRPIVYSANGSHANYAITGTHDHTIPNLNLPGGVLEDHTDQGTQWDPVADGTAYFYSYDVGSNSFTDLKSGESVNWLYWVGKWGDEQYPTSYPGQYVLFGQAHYSSGPTGPIDKQLNRTNVCPDNGDDCILRTELGP